MPAGFWVLSDHSKLSSLEMKRYRNLQMGSGALAYCLHHLPHTDWHHDWHHEDFGENHAIDWSAYLHLGKGWMKIQGSWIRKDFLQEKETGKRTEIKLFGFPTRLNFYQLGPPKKPPSSNLQLTSWWVSCGCPDCRSWGVPTLAIKQILEEIILLKSWLCVVMSFPQ